MDRKYKCALRNFTQRSSTGRGVRDHSHEMVANGQTRGDGSEAYAWLVICVENKTASTIVR